MEFLKFVVSVLAVLSIASCQPPVVFGEPQPVGGNALNTIPSNYRGTYWCSTDSASLFIDDKALIRRKDLLVKLGKDEIAENEDLAIVNGQLYVDDWNAFFPIEALGDTVISHVILRDTIFAIDREQVLKPFKGHLVLNIKLKDDVWEVLVVSQGEGQVLTISQAEIPEKLSQLDSITTIKTFWGKDSVQTQIYLKPTAYEFERILQKGLLFQKSCTEYVKVFPVKELLD